MRVFQICGMGILRENEDTGLFGGTGRHLGTTVEIRAMKLERKQTVYPGGPEF